ncbi:MAG TPA: undecaprenyl-diphosphate phosphatase [Actinomycetota bacterium]|nr:undecaprenyl-diphosphate phosphatase [Actinomycetota bacterium]
MSILEALVLGVVQGLTEFLPVSSSAHLALVPELLGWGQPTLAYAVLLHAGTLLALFAYFRRELVATLQGMMRPGPARRFVVLLIAGTVPAAVIGVAFEEWFEDNFGRPFQVALQLILTGLILFGIEALARRRPPPPADPQDLTGLKSLVDDLNPAKAAAVGFAQAFAIIPGISRSGATIAAGLMAGLSRPQAARFSFLLSIPIVFGTTLFKVPDLAGEGTGAGPLAVGFLASAVTGYVAIAGTIAFLQRRGLHVFAIYCVLAGSLTAFYLR